MHTHFTKVLLGMFAMGCFSTAAMAQSSYLDASSKMRGEYGNAARSSANYRPMNRTAPMNSVAQAPTEERRMSYDSAQNKEKSNKAQEAKKDAPQVAQRESTTTTRSFSYDPGTTSNMRAMRRQTNRPTYELPRTDSRKLGGG